MLDVIWNVLQTSAADDYQIRMTTTKSHEFFFIRHQLDQNRCKDVTHYEVTVYKKHDQYSMGQATVSIPMNSTQEDIQQKIEGAIYAASFVKNPIFSLLDDAKTAQCMTKYNPLSVAKDILVAIEEVEESENVFINSYEVFIDEKVVRMITSKGIDITYNYLDTMVELVVNAKDETHEIELYRCWNMGTCNKEQLKKNILDTFVRAIDRTKTVTTPKQQKATLLLSGQDAIRFYEFYIALTSASLKYQEISQFEKGQSIYQQSCASNPLTLVGCKELPGSNQNYPFDADGKVVSDRIIIEDGIVKNFHGSKRFMDYIHESNSGIYRNWKVSGGMKSVEDIRKQPYFEPVEFSDFQCDSTTGDFFGEVRLGYLYDGFTTTIVTGGSVSGNVWEVQQNMWMSKETSQFNNYEIPSLTCLFDVSVTGVE